MSQLETLAAIDMKNLSRRWLLSRAAAGFATIGLFSAASPISEGHFVWKPAEWNFAEFRKLVNDPARIKHAYDIAQIEDGKFPNNIKNSFNRLKFGFGVAKGETPDRRPRCKVPPTCSTMTTTSGRSTTSASG